MPDVYATIGTADRAVQERLADVLELRAADSQQRAMLEDYLRDMPLPAGARVLEIGCGTGAVSRTVARLPGVAEVIGVDPSEVFLDRARALSEGMDNVAFAVGDGRELPFDARSFDAVVCHTVISHVPDPERLLAEALRVTREGGALAIFDGDYATTTVAVAEDDPLQACADAAIAGLVHDRLIVRRLGALVREAGWRVTRLRSHGYLDTDDPGYMLVVVERGADFLVARGVLGEQAAGELKAEARRRAESGGFFGFIAYASLIATR